MANRGLRHEPVTDSERARRSTDADGCDVSADEALEAARSLPPGSERNAALKKAGVLRNAADAYGLVFARRGRPRR
jgi:hypothetical protein